MKIIGVLLLGLMLSGVASAQTYFRDGTSQFLDIASGAATATTTATSAQTLYVRLSLGAATEGAYYSIASSGSVQEATLAAVDQATSSFLPVNTDRIIKVGPGKVIVAIAVSTGGVLTVTELTQ
jgi:hypothetical protein